MRFESLVNTEGFKTKKTVKLIHSEFESLVNTEGFKTQKPCTVRGCEFESLVNTEGFKTVAVSTYGIDSLRVLLIRKDSKQ